MRKLILGMVVAVAFASTPAIADGQSGRHAHVPGEEVTLFSVHVKSQQRYAFGRSINNDSEASAIAEAVEECHRRHEIAGDLQAACVVDRVEKTTH